MAQTFALWQSCGRPWRFNPPGAPHMGGAWERLVRSVKRCMSAILGDTSLSDEVLLCVLAEAEWIVNNHPLTHVSPDPNEEEALTPNHFLHGGTKRGTMSGIGPEGIDAVLRRSWRTSQQLADHFWRRFAIEVIPVVNMRTKWYARAEPLKVGDLVMLPIEGRRGKWKRGRIEETISKLGDDQVRQVRVATSWRADLEEK